MNVINGLADVGKEEYTVSFWCSIIIFIFAIIVLVVYFVKKKETTIKNNLKSMTKHFNVFFCGFLFLVALMCGCSSILSCAVKNNKTIDTLTGAETGIELVGKMMKRN